MTHDETRIAQAALFCAELHRHVDEVDVRASEVAARLRIQMGLRGRDRRPGLIDSLQGQLKELAAERRRIMEMLAALGHRYPCPDGEYGPAAG